MIIIIINIIIIIIIIIIIPQSLQQRNIRNTSDLSGCLCFGTNSHVYVLSMF